MMDAVAIALEQAQRMCGVPRDPKWPYVERAHLDKNPACAACGRTHKVQVHHKKPFHLFPALELEPTNLITLCQAEGDGCHFTFGHFKCWAAWNPTVEEDCAAYRLKMVGRLKSLTLPPDPSEE